ncbi:Lethal(2) giant larvae protein 1 [Schistosoma japonicum]|uniref:Lethal(2) giant larvae protein 1 n=2 Tax=Schistosoma japonicum TaxID=6182 RepID=A0A4Z2CPT0_SCHJA|nr:Lethal(2) giant larvae protein 1 [Schistosoma japonicum]
MAQRIFEPFRKLPHQLQNLDFVKRLHDYTLGKHTDSYCCYQSSAYGCLESPSCLAFDDILGLLAIGTSKGLLKIYGSPGVVFTVQREGPPITSVLFLPGEGRIVCASIDGALHLFELDSSCGRWSLCSHIRVQQNVEQDRITCLCLGHGIIYIGSGNGTLRQVAVKNGHMTLGDDTLTACTSSIISESVPADKRDQLGVDSPIVSLELQPQGNHLLIAYAGGCVAVAVPQTVPSGSVTQPAVSVDGVTAPTAEGEVVTPSVDELAPTITQETQGEAVPSDKGETAGETTQSILNDSAVESTPSTPAKGHSDKRSTLKFKALTRSLRPDTPKLEEQVEPSLPVPPAPRISHLLLRDQPVEWASWRVSTIDSLSTEVVVAYGDGAFQVWPIVAAVSDQLFEPIIVSMIDPPNTPYGPLPCGAINKILVNPSANGGLLTVFCGGLPRPQFENRYAVSVLQDHEHHVCYQFGSKVIDFVLIPSEGNMSNETVPGNFMTKPSAPSHSATLLVLTERELVAVDLTQPDWPAYDSPYLNCMDFSPVTAITHIGQVPSALIQRLHQAAHTTTDDITNCSWPIWGGSQADGNKKNLAQNAGNDIIALGHSNGWVTLWAIGRGDTTIHLGTLPTSSLFNSADLQNDQKCGSSALGEETWPPFRPVGYCSRAQRHTLEGCDPRLAISQLLILLGSPIRSGVSDSVAPDTLTLVVGGASGQVSLWVAGSEGFLHTPELTSFEPDVSRVYINLIDQSEEDKYIWKDAPCLRPTEGVPQYCTPTGLTFHPSHLVQLNPPSQITSLALELSWNLLAVGSSHGFALLDLFNRSIIHTHFTYDSSGPAKIFNTVSTVQNVIMARGKQIKSNIRHSFRRLKNLRTSTTTTERSLTEPAPVDEQYTPNSTEQTVKETSSKDETKEKDQPVEVDEKIEAQEGIDIVEVTDQPIASESTEEQKPQLMTDNAEVDVTPEHIHLGQEDIASSAVRCLLFSDTYILNGRLPNQMGDRTPSIWVGTSSGKALAYSLSWKNTSGPVKATLCKEIQSHHHSPIVSLDIVDAINHGPIMHSQAYRNSCIESDEATEQKESTKPSETPAEVTTESVKDTEIPMQSTQSTQDIHQLLLCSEEKVKLFSLPSLRAIYDHKFVDRLRMLGMSLTSGTGSTSKPEKDVNEEADAAVGESETAYVNASQVNRKRVTGFGLQNFTSGSGENTKLEWNAVATLLDGQIAVLSLPSLRKVFKERCYPGYLPSTLPYVATRTFNTHIFWFIGCRLLVSELTPIPSLNSFAVPVNNVITDDFVAIRLPDWARIKKDAPVEDDILKVTQTASVDESPQIAGNFATDETKIDFIPVVEEEIIPTAKKVNDITLENGQNVGDVTLDSIKEYLNGTDVTLVVKTTELSTEKRTLVEGGKITTTVHEVEKIDGKVTKDDIVKFVTDGEPEITVGITGTA